MTSDPAAAWHARAEDLARWAMARLMNRTDRRGGYYTDVKGETQSRNLPGKGPERGHVSHELLTTHFRAAQTEDVVGAHALGADSRGKWPGVDIDAHPGTKADPDANRRFALGIYGELSGLGFRPLLTESNGKGGYHVRALFAAPVPGRILFHFGRWLVRAHADFGFEKPPETFPKQEELGEGRPWGNWLRLPGRHHTRDFWPRVWDGSAWLCGADAVGHVLSLTGAPQDLIPFDVVAASGEGGEDEPATARERSGWDVLPGTDFDLRADWPGILEPHGWKLDRGGDHETWTRPGKAGGTSATLGFCKGNGFKKFYVWTNGAAPLEQGKTYTPFWAHVVLTHGGAAPAAFRDLADRGYGRRRPKPSAGGRPHRPAAEARVEPDPFTPPPATGPVVVVGRTVDANALARAGLTAVVRPVGDDLGPFVASLRAVPTDRSLVVLGENDARPDEKHPGWDAAEQLARRLAAALGRPVCWATPPAGIRDAAVWVEDFASGFAEAEDWPGVGREIAAYLIEHGRAAGAAQPATRFKLIDSAEFLAGDYRPEWLVPRILVRGQPCVIAGPSKGMKTSLLIDLAVSMATATPFLGEFPVHKRTRVAVVSGESGEHTLKETCLRVLAAKNLAPADLTGWLKWEFNLPTFTDPASVTDFGRQLARVEADVSMIDPTYLAMGEVDAKNMFDMGRALRAVNDVLRQLRPDLTVALVHHANRMLPVGEPMELQHLAYSGLEQFARQFVLLNRRTSYGNDGTHKLWVRVGGSAGHGGLWGVDIDEGLVGEDFAGRRWNVAVLDTNEVKAEAAAGKSAEARDKKRAEMDDDDRAVLKVIDDEVAKGRGGATMSCIRATAAPRIRVTATFTYDRATQAIRRLLGAGAIEETKFPKVSGNGATREENGYHRPAD